MRATLKDVAARAGVSIKTVSNYLHDYPYMRVETRARIKQAIDALGYRPNITARNLRQGSSGLIALAVPNILNPYLSELAQYVVDEAARHSLTVLIDSTQGEREREQLAVAGFARQVIDGLILLPDALQIDDLQKRDTDTPLVLLGERVERVAEVADCVAIDSRHAARAATEHLISIGRRRIGFLGGFSKPRARIPRLRESGYRDALRGAGLPFDRELIGQVNRHTPAQGTVAMRDLLAREQPIDAVFCQNDLLALGAARALLAHGRRIPDDVALVGIDDIEAGRYHTPTLSTIAPDKACIARTAVRMLVERLGPDGAGPPRQVTAGFTLLARESTGGGPSSASPFR